MATRGSNLHTDKELRRQIKFMLNRVRTHEKLLFNGRHRLGQLLTEFMDEGGDLRQFDIDEPTLDLLIAAGQARRT